ncbi:MAG: hypothetical protein JST59_20280 [Actinobacteria bacterium]|nr:hypothetical protein [Actinomycetota bacterium]
MNAIQKARRNLALAVLLGFSLLAVFASSANAIGEPTTIIFKELEKGATNQFVDNAPEAKLNHGVVSISPGDMLLTTNPLSMEGRIVGKIRIACTATSAGNTKNPASAGFSCTGIAKIPGGTLILVAELGESPTEGAITGGTGNYAGAKGSFVSRQGRGSSTNTVTLLE